MMKNKIADLRSELGLTQNELADKLNISRASLSHYEAMRRDPDTETLRKIADFFGVSIDYLLCQSNIRNYDDKKATSETAKQAEDIIKIDPDLFVQMCRATYLPEEDRKKIREYSAMLLEKHLREEKEKAKKGNDIPK